MHEFHCLKVYMKTDLKAAFGYISVLLAGLSTKVIYALIPLLALECAPREQKRTTE
jgi:hypothetical protein